MRHDAFAARQLAAPQRPPLHCPEQHAPCAVHTSLVPRQVPAPRHWPSVHESPTQQSVGCEQGSFNCRHCERQVKVTGLHKPAQHSKSLWQVALAAKHAAGRHKPASHEPSQQSFDSLHEAPDAPQTTARHSEPTHNEPEQQSLG